MEKLMKELLLLLVDRQPIGPKLAQIALEGYTVAFQRAGDSVYMVVQIYKYDSKGTKIQISQMIDMDLVLGGL